MLKLLGSVCILAAGGYVWTQQMGARRREMESYRDMIAALQEMEDTIRLSRTPLPRLLERQMERRGGDTAAFFQNVRQGLDAGKSLTGAWRNAAAILPWRETDRGTLEELGQNLTGDAEQACKGIELVCRSLERPLEELRQQQPDFEKRSTALCFSGAALLIILLI